MLILLYLVAIILANLSAMYFGPSATIINAFLLIGLDLAVRDSLHDKWEKQIAAKMPLLIVSGSLLSMIININAWHIAVASMAAFGLSETIKTLFYIGLKRKSRIYRAGVANIFASAVDSTVFPTLAFGELMIWVVLGQFVAKVAGAMIWSLLLPKPKQTLNKPFLI